jgi:uncharacterized protein YbjT (DUF2867 family)
MMVSKDDSGSGRSALVVGATGLVGGYCVDLLLADEAYARISTIGRRPAARSHPKLAQHVADLDRLAEWLSAFEVDDVFSCLGTTIRKAGSYEQFWRVDVEYPAAAARLAAEAGARNYLLVSALGADARSRVPYNRAKGEVEELVRSVGINSWCFRPSLLLGERAENRPAERLAAVLLTALRPALAGPLRRYRAISAATVARAMVAAARSGAPGRVVESDEIPALAEA